MNRSLVSLLCLSVTALVSVASAAVPDRRIVLDLPDVEVRYPLFTGTGDVVFVDAADQTFLRWDLVRSPVPLSSTTQPGRLLPRANDTLVAWYQFGAGGTEIAVVALDQPGVEYVVSAGLNANFDDLALAGNCVAFSVFDADPLFTKSIYRACLDRGTVRRTEIDGNFVRPDGTPVYDSQGVVGWGNDFVWTAGPFADPDHAAPVFSSGPRNRLDVVHAAADMLAVHLNAKTALFGTPINFGGDNFLVRYDRARGRIAPLVSSPFYVQWSDMNPRSEVVYNTDFGAGDGQRTYVSRKNDEREKIGPLGGFGSVISENVIAYTWESAPRAFDLRSASDVSLASGAYDESIRAWGERVLWIDFDGTIGVSVPAKDAARALEDAVKASPGERGRMRTLLASAKAARAALPNNPARARVALARFIAEVDDGLARRQIGATLAADLVRTATAIHDALAPSEYGQCTDGRNNDGDDLTDCLDADCRGDGACIEAFACGDGVDNDGNGWIDCADAGCSGQAECTELGSKCTDGLDNDGDGMTDCRDPDCEFEVPQCSEQVCDDGLDNDGDGSVDCGDPNCDGYVVCQ